MQSYAPHTPFLLLATTLSVGLTPGLVAAADMLGDVIKIERNSPTIDTALEPPVMVTVATGDADAYFAGAPDPYAKLNLDANTIDIDFLGTAGFVSANGASFPKPVPSGYSSWDWLPCAVSFSPQIIDQLSADGMRSNNSSALAVVR